MYFNKILPAGLLLMFAACNNPETTSETTTTTETTTDVKAEENATPAPSASGETCYGSKTGNSTVEMALTVNDGSVAGTLNYLPEAKDKNTGTIRGKMRGDTLLADYTFMSEGVESVREVIFLKTADGYKEGYGPVKDQKGKMVFEDLKKIDFSQSVPLVKVDCNKGKL